MSLTRPDVSRVVGLKRVRGVANKGEFNSRLADPLAPFLFKSPTGC